VTYTLHIVIRFELEQELIAGALSVDDLPLAWNDKMRRYLGVEVPSDSLGVLQDVHWSAGYFGYFPTYSLGSILASQLWVAIERDIPDLERQIGRGEFQPLRAWLGEHIHKHGRKFTPRELLSSRRASCFNACSASIGSTLRRIWATCTPNLASFTPEKMASIPPWPRPIPTLPTRSAHSSSASTCSSSPARR